MLQAVMKLALITVGTLILATLIVIAVRFIGNQSQFMPPAHPWFARSFWWILETTPEQLCTTPDIDTLTPTKDWIVQLHVVRKNEAWVVPCPTGQPLPIEDFLNRSEHRDWLLDVHGQDTWGLDELAAKVGKFEAKDHFALTTPSQKVSVYLRKKAPDWLFAADSASLLRLRLFESLYVETAIDFWPDFVLLNFTPQIDFHLDARGGAELKRRKKRVVWKWVEGQSEEPTSEIDGVMTNRPSAAQQKFGERH